MIKTIALIVISAVAVFAVAFIPRVFSKGRGAIYAVRNAVQRLVALGRY